MKIANAKIRNLFGIKFFDYDGKNIELSGKNGVNKSAVLDAFKLCLTNKSPREYVLLQGETEGEVFIQMDSGLSIHRKIRTTKSDYKSIKQEGDKIEKNEAFLRELFTELQLNPVEFSKMDAQEQNRIILDLIDFKWDLAWIQSQFSEIPQGVNYDQNILCVLHDIQADEGHYFTTRQDINREVRNKQAFIEEIGSTLPQNYNADHWESINLGDLYKDIEAIRTKNDQITLAKSMVQSRDAKVKEFQSALQIEKGNIEEKSIHLINEFESIIKNEENSITSFNSDLQTKISNFEKEAIVTRNTLEKEIMELEALIKQKRQDILDISSNTNVQIESAKKECDLNIGTSKAKIQELRHDIETEQNNKKSSLELAQKTYESNIAGMEGEIKQHEELAKIDLTPFADLQEEADNTEKMKAFINEYKRMLGLKSDIEGLIKNSEDITVKIEKARTLPGEILATSNIPIEGLTIKDGIPLINGLPISNLSDGEKFELCISVATKNPSSLQMVLIDGIECLASANRDKVYANLKSKGVQFIATRTTDEDVLTVIEL